MLIKYGGTGLSEMCNYMNEYLSTATKNVFRIENIAYCDNKYKRRQKG